MITTTKTLASKVFIFDDYDKSDNKSNDNESDNKDTN